MHRKAKLLGFFTLFTLTLSLLLSSCEDPAASNGEEVMDTIPKSQVTLIVSNNKDTVTITWSVTNAESAEFTPLFRMGDSDNSLALIDSAVIKGQRELILLVDSSGLYYFEVELQSDEATLFSNVLAQEVDITRQSLIAEQNYRVLTVTNPNTKSPLAFTYSYDSTAWFEAQSLTACTLLVLESSPIHFKATNIVNYFDTSHNHLTYTPLLTDFEETSLALSSGSNSITAEIVPDYDALSDFSRTTFYYTSSSNETFSTEEKRFFPPFSSIWKSYAVTRFESGDSLVSDTALDTLSLYVGRFSPRASTDRSVTLDIQLTGTVSLLRAKDTASWDTLFSAIDVDRDTLFDTLPDYDTTYYKLLVHTNEILQAAPTQAVQATYPISKIQFEDSVVENGVQIGITFLNKDTLPLKGWYDVSLLSGSDDTVKVTSRPYQLTPKEDFIDSLILDNLTYPGQHRVFVTVHDSTYGQITYQNNKTYFNYPTSKEGATIYLNYIEKNRYTDLLTLKMETRKEIAPSTYRVTPKPAKYQIWVGKEQYNMKLVHEMSDSAAKYIFPADFPFEEGESYYIGTLADGGKNGMRISITKVCMEIPLPQFEIEPDTADTNYGIKINFTQELYSPYVIVSVDGTVLDTTIRTDREFLTIPVPEARDYKISLQYWEQRTVERDTAYGPVTDTLFTMPTRNKPERPSLSVIRSDDSATISVKAVFKGVYDSIQIERSDNDGITYSVVYSDTGDGYSGYDGFSSFDPEGSQSSLYRARTFYRGEISEYSDEITPVIYGGVLYYPAAGMVFERGETIHAMWRASMTLPTYPTVGLFKGNREVISMGTAGSDKWKAALLHENLEPGDDYRFRIGSYHGYDFSGPYFTVK